MPQPPKELTTEQLMQEAIKTAQQQTPEEKAKTRQLLWDSLKKKAK